MSGSTFGTLFRVTTFGESHGVGIGVIVDGVPAGLPCDPEFIQHEMDRRRPGQSSVTTPRSEADKVQILSGVFEGKFTGTPVGMVIYNENQRSQDYADIAQIFRPGHADATFHAKFGFRDYRGGGRSSGRETATRVAAGAIAKLFLRTLKVDIRASALEIGGVPAQTYNPDEIEKNLVRCADPVAAVAMIKKIREAQKNHDSVGGIVGLRVTGVPAGWGEPVFDKLDALLAHAMLSIGGVKGFACGSGFDAPRSCGSINNQEPNSGGILGGISNGNPLEFQIAVKPTSSIAQEQNGFNIHGEPVKLKIKGRHDPCLVPRVVVVSEAMTALVLADLALRQRATRL